MRYKNKEDNRTCWKEYKDTSIVEYEGETEDITKKWILKNNHKITQRRRETMR